MLVIRVVWGWDLFRPRGCFRYFLVIICFSGPIKGYRFFSGIVIEYQEKERSSSTLPPTAPNVDGTPREGYPVGNLVSQ